MENRSAGPFSGAPFRHGVELFNSGRFFEAHEAWEEIWRAEKGSTKLALQGLIQIAAGFVKLGRGNAAAARRLWLAGIEKLEGAGRIDAAFDPRTVAAWLGEWIESLDRGEVSVVTLPPLA